MVVKARNIALEGQRECLLPEPRRDHMNDSAKCFHGDERSRAASTLARP